MEVDMPNEPVGAIATEIDEPILFRTSSRDVYTATLATGSLWLRSDQYFREIEDTVRRDRSEGTNGTSTVIPIKVAPQNGPSVHIFGDGEISQRFDPHYILSMHGSGIRLAQVRAFGGHTFGIRSISRLSAEVLYRCSQLVRCNGYRYGPVSYQRTALTHSLHSIGGSPLCLSRNPASYIRPLNVDVLRKQPMFPFVDQDEWRIVVFADGYLEGNPRFPLKINVDPGAFFPYLFGNE